MTGFGRGTHSTGDWEATVEISTVNRKQRDIVVQIPRELQELEPRIRKTAEPSISRGRMQISVLLAPSNQGQRSFCVDEWLVKEFCNAFEIISRISGRQISPDASAFLSHPGMIETGISVPDSSNSWQAIEPAMGKALTALLSMREAEGNDLKTDLLKRISIIGEFSLEIGETAPERPAKQRDLLLKRLADSGLSLDPSDERVLKEVALFADRCDISEELTRLDSHLERFLEYLSSAEPTGRPLDFLCQEIFRELNTIGSKANDSGIAQTIVRAKAELEKAREQVQNVE